MITRILSLACGIFMATNLLAQSAAPTKASFKTTTQFTAKRLDTGINAPVADFAPVKYGERTYFSTMRLPQAGAEPVSRIFSYTPGEMPKLDEEFNPKKSSNHVACPVLMPDASRMYFSICRDAGMTDCEIWYRDREFEGTWGPPVKLPEQINQRGSNNTQPAIGWDIVNKQYVLYFASNRKGSRGKMDIWASNISWDGKYGEPICLPFNTAEDEVTPSFNQTAQTLYFSSNGHKGAGRFDVYSIEKNKDGSWSSPTNMGRPFNTAYDDLFFTFHEASQTGYLASDRPGSQCNGSVEGFNCFDIYELRKNYTQEPLGNKAPTNK